MLDSKIYRAVEVLLNLLVLNLIWAVACLPVITAFPATAAMFGVVREWVKGNDNGIVLPFTRHLRANFVQSFWIGLVWIAVCGILLVDFVLVGGAEAWLKIPAFVVLAFFAFFLTITSMFLFPVIVNYEGRWRNTIKNSFLMAIAQPLTTIKCIMAVALVYVVVSYVPILVLVAGSGTAYLIYSFCKQAFDRIEALKGIEWETPQETGSWPS
jgi:uncharacterized membrane protein YesL